VVPEEYTDKNTWGSVRIPWQLEGCISDCQKKKDTNGYQDELTKNIQKPYPFLQAFFL
jgi:hypothetical protein